MKTAYLVYITQTVRVAAETEQEAQDTAIAYANQNQLLTIFNVEDIVKDTKCPYDPKFDDDSTPAEKPEDWAARSAKEITAKVDNLLSYSFAGYSVLDVIAIAGNDEHEINASEAKKILDGLKLFYRDFPFVSIATLEVQQCIDIFIVNREKTKA